MFVNGAKKQKNKNPKKHKCCLDTWWTKINLDCRPSAERSCGLESNTPHPPPPVPLPLPCLQIFNRAYVGNQIKTEQALLQMAPFGRLMSGFDATCWNQRVSRA